MVIATSPKARSRSTTQTSRARRGQGDAEVHGHRGLAHPALGGEDREDLAVAVAFAVAVGPLIASQVLLRPVDRAAERGRGRLRRTTARCRPAWPGRRPGARARAGSGRPGGGVRRPGPGRPGPARPHVERGPEDDGVLTATVEPAVDLVGARDDLCSAGSAVVSTPAVVVSASTRIGMVVLPGFGSERSALNRFALLTPLDGGDLRVGVEQAEGELAVACWRRAPARPRPAMTATVSRVFGSCSVVCAPVASVVVVATTVVVPAPITWTFGSSSAAVAALGVGAGHEDRDLVARVHEAGDPGGVGQVDRDRDLALGDGQAGGRRRSRRTSRLISCSPG